MSTQSAPAKELETNVQHHRAKVIRALAHPTRLWIVERLGKGESCVCEFVEQLSFDFSTISKHLLVLKNAGLIAAEKRGKQVYYRLLVPCALDFLGCVDKVLRAQKCACRR